VVPAGDGRADRDELLERVQLTQLAGDAGDAVGTVLLGLVLQDSVSAALSTPAG
jgi:hypothetical protein